MCPQQNHWIEMEHSVLKRGGKYRTHFENKTRGEWLVPVIGREVMRQKLNPCFENDEAPRRMNIEIDGRRISKPQWWKEAYLLPGSNYSQSVHRTIELAIESCEQYGSRTSTDSAGNCSFIWLRLWVQKNNYVIHSHVKTLMIFV